MKYRIAYLVALIIIIGSCDDRNGDSSKEKQRHSNLSNKLWLEKFSLPYNQTLSTDSNSFIFYKSKSFDTSFVVQLLKKDSIVKGIYYQVLPTYHRDMEDFLDQDHQLFAFEGLSFKISPAMWRTITDNCKGKLFTVSETPDDNLCLDCPNYFLSFDEKQIASDNSNRASFDIFAAFLKDTLINKLIRDRKPRLTIKH